MAEPDNTRVHVFVCYSHKDLRWLQRLQVHLTPLAREYDLDLWDDTRLRPGSKWRQEIRKAVSKANVAVLIVSADFLASEFIRTNELPPLLKAAEEEGMLILPIISSPSVFHLTTELTQFQSVNSPSAPLISATEGEQEAVFARLAEELFQRASVLRAQATQPATKSGAMAKEAFLNHSTWTRLIKIGDWIFDEQRARIIGSGMGAYLLSREEYGETGFAISAQLEFTNFQPKSTHFGMNAGIIFGWKTQKETNRYYNILLTGSELLLERVGFMGGGSGDYKHITDPVSLPIPSERPIAFEVRVDADKIEIDVNNKRVLSQKRPTGVVGRVGLRPWRSQMDCTMFTVTGNDLSAR